MSKARLYKYFSEERWADAFLKGEMLFRSLSYFRDYEDMNVREDQYEGTTVFQPPNGLIMNIEGQTEACLLPRYAFRSTTKQDEIFVFCLSRSLSEDLWQRFNAVTCVEISNVPTFCQRIEAALPTTAKFPTLSNRSRIGHRVQYYETADPPRSRWALPDMIAISKQKGYAWQDEFRLVFSLTDALEFENINPCITNSVEREPPKPAAAEHYCHTITVGDLSDICRKA